MNKKQATEEINKCLEILRQPISLADFLGWEEDVVYTNGRLNYKIEHDSLFCYDNGSWGLSGYNDDFKNTISKFREFEKIEKTYNLILQKGYRELFDLQDCEKYLTIDTTDGTVFNSKYSTNNSKYQAQFTLEEIEEIKNKYNVDLSIYDVVEVQE